MKKKFNIKQLFSIMLTMILLLGFSTKAKADSYPDTVTFTESKTLTNYKTTLLTNSSGGTGSYGTTYKKAKFSNGTVVYAFCLNHEKNAPSVNTTLYRRNLTNIETQRKYAFIYILENGLGGNWSLGGNFTEEEKYYITQLAIWGVQGTDGGGLNLDAVPAQKDQKRKNILAAAKQLRDAALKHNSAPASSLSLNTATAGKTEVYATADKKYYRTDDIVTSGSGFNSYVVKLTNAPAGTEIVEVGTNAVKKSGDSLKAGQKFYVRVPASKVSSSLNLKVAVTVQTVSKDLVTYSSKESGKQDIGIPVTLNNPKSLSLTFTAKPVGYIKLRKVGIYPSGKIEDLKNVKITVKNSNGEAVITWISGDPGAWSNLYTLPVGTYKIVEENAPEGFIKSEDINIEVKALETREYEIKNYTEAKYVTIRKVDATTGAELPGAQLVLKNSVGQVVDSWTSGTTPHTVEKVLAPGKYTLSETIAPKGYQKSTKTVSFMVNDSGGVDAPVVMENVPETSVKISKQDITTGKELPGAKLTVKNSKGEVVDEWVSTTEPHYLPADLPAGDYKLIEVTSPKGYGLSEEVIDFKITNDGVEKTVTMTNSPIPVTADMPVVTIVVILIVTSLVAGVGIFKLNKQEA